MKSIQLTQIAELLKANGQYTTGIFLGAGCSRNSEVPLASEIISLLEWLCVERAKGIKPTQKKSIFWSQRFTSINEVIAVYAADKHIAKRKEDILSNLRRQNEISVRQKLHDNQNLINEIPYLKGSPYLAISIEQWNMIADDSWYGFMFEVYFGTNKKLQAAFFEKLITNRIASIGYLHLALLIRFGYFSTAMTTNFDTLLEDTFNRHTKSFGKVIQSLVEIKNNEAFDTKYVPSQVKSIFYYKIHGGFFSVDLRNSFADINFKDNRLYGALSEPQVLLIMGFSGADFRIMNHLLEHHKLYRLSRIVWIGYDSADTLHPNVQTLLQSERFHFFSLRETGLDFDTFWAKLAIQLVPKNAINETIANYKKNINWLKHEFTEKFEYSKHKELFDAIPDKELIDWINNSVLNERNAYEVEKEASAHYYVERLHARLIKQGRTTISDHHIFYYNWGVKLKKIGFYEDSVIKFKRSLKYPHTIHYKVMTLDNIAGCLNMIGDFYNANRIYQEIEIEITKNFREEEAWYFNKVSNLYNQSYFNRSLGDFFTAQRYNELSRGVYFSGRQSGKIRQPNFGRDYLNFNELYFDTNHAYILKHLGNTEESTRIYEDVIHRMDDELFDEVAISNLAYIKYTEGKVQESFRLFLTAFKRVTSDQNVNIGLFHTLKELGNAVSEEDKDYIYRRVTAFYGLCREHVSSLDSTIVLLSLYLFSIGGYFEYHDDVLKLIREKRPEISYQERDFRFVNTLDAHFDFYTKMNVDYRGHTVIIVSQ